MEKGGKITGEGRWFIFAMHEGITRRGRVGFRLCWSHASIQITLPSRSSLNVSINHSLSLSIVGHPIGVIKHLE